MLKTITSILFILIIAAQVFSKAVVCISFELNRDYIAKNLCINREKPKSCCQGSCQLKKKMQNEEDQEKKQGSSLRDKMEVQFCQQPQHFEALHHNSFLQHTDLYNNQYFFLSSANYFHPPGA